MLTTVQSKIICKPQERPRKLLLAAALCLVVFSFRAEAQEEPSCVPAKAFARVGALLQKQDYPRAKALLRGS